MNCILPDPYQSGVIAGRKRKCHASLHHMIIADPLRDFAFAPDQTIAVTFSIYALKALKPDRRITVEREIPDE